MAAFDGFAHPTVLTLQRLDGGPPLSGLSSSILDALGGIGGTGTTYGN